MYAFFYEKEILGIFQRNVTVVEQKEVVPKPAPAVKEPPLEAVPTVPRQCRRQWSPRKRHRRPGQYRLDLLIEATEEHLA